ncbi:hypothetical protein BTH42_32615 [Burkholderia sp. SRS-W-2-2016]|uniref:manganese catalase family protein n=1 Tax=Burkholderia sp. SRS-W-2-2016 TaxID=1926878 RepID=UPI00094ADA3F|nr:manganese catalase family protein [Burkholderia sp. SRS-W-2-2016]OLL27568.1 hypothetical protein BTH42_32615 [Burkholderia sp. SRS-W-2-2016]
MFMHNKRLQYTVRVGTTNPGLANLMLGQFGGPQGELAAAMRYFTQAVAKEDPRRKDMLFDIATEELIHLEIIGLIVAILNRGAKGELAEAVEQRAELYRRLNGAGNDSHVTQVLYGGGPPLTNSGGVPWTAAYIDTIGAPTADGGDGSASVGLEAQQESAVTAMATRLRSDPSSDPTTGAELGSTLPPTNDVE